MKSFFLFGICLTLVAGCNSPGNKDTSASSETTSELAPALNAEQAQRLLHLPLQCIGQEYPNKPGQTLTADVDLKSPHELHPAFYGCFDWHSSVHGHWSLVFLLSEFPDLPETDTIVQLLKQHISAENIAVEMDFFSLEQHKTFERMYGWAWLLKLAEQLQNWDHPAASELSENLEPLAELLADRYIEFLPKLLYPVRVGTHTNTAFGLSFAYDYALASGHDSLKAVIEDSARRLYLKDRGCPLGWEPSGYDFLSPCLEEAALMSKVLNNQEFSEWIVNFLPMLSDPGFYIDPGKVTDRTDGLLVHLDGVNFSRAWCFYQLAGADPGLAHLKRLGDEHIMYSLENITDDHYEGGHWLASFALYALRMRNLRLAAG